MIHMHKVSMASEFIQTDVTALKIMNDKILAGIGCYLHVFEHDTGICILRQHIFKGQKIHGFCLSDVENSDKIVIYGGKHIAVLTTLGVLENSLSDCDIAAKEWKTFDWILTVAWMKDQSKLALVLAHNIVEIWDPQHRSKLHQLTCQEKCILYSALLLGSSLDYLVMFAGTVFSEVVIWSPLVEPEDSKSDAVVWHRLKGHKGVIFGVEFAETEQKLLTCSDDRSIIVWRIYGLPNWQEAKFEKEFVLFGHTARVWRVVPVTSGFLSIGEDSLLCYWNYEGKMLQQKCAHQGGSCWSIDIDPIQELVVTGGADGAINKWPLKNTIHSTSLPSLHPNSARKVVITAGGCIVVTTQHGSVYQWKNDRWQLVFCDKAFESYALIATSRCRTKVAIASLHGHIAILTEKDEEIQLLCTSQVHSCKILSLHWLSSDHLLTSTNEASAFTISQWQVVDGLSLYCHCTGQGPSKLINTALVLSGLEDKHWLLIGDQGGRIWLYDSKPDTLPLLHSLLLPSDGITCLHSCHRRKIIYATGKDGRLYTLQVDLENAKLRVLHSYQTGLGWLAAVMETTTQGTWLLAFYKENLAVWNRDYQMSVLNIPCGGGHRSWDLVTNSDADTLTFCYVREKIVHQVTTSLRHVTASPVRLGLHYHTVNSCLCLPKQQLLISGSDDSTLRVWSTLDMTVQLHAVLYGHVSSVRALCFVAKENEATSVTLFSAGGRAQLIAWAVTMHQPQKHVQTQQLDAHILCETEVANTHSVRHVVPTWKETYLRPRLTADTRYMDLCAHKCDSERIVVIAACSDSTIRLFHLESHKLQLKATLTYHHCCVSKLSAAMFEKHCLLASASTDGHVALWTLERLENMDDNASVQPVWSGRIHQSGVNSLKLQCSQSADQQVLLLWSGGDDNKMALTKITQNKDGCCVKMVPVWNSVHGHSAQVTGIAALNPHWLITTSVDQRVIAWKQETENCWEPKEMLISTVADIQGMVVMKLDRNSCTICVYGKGFEILKVAGIFTETNRVMSNAEIS